MHSKKYFLIVRVVKSRGGLTKGSVESLDVFQNILAADKNYLHMFPTALRYQTWFKNCFYPALVFLWLSMTLTYLPWTLGTVYFVQLTESPAAVNSSSSLLSIQLKGYFSIPWIYYLQLRRKISTILRWEIDLLRVFCHSLHLPPHFLFLFSFCPWLNTVLWCSWE